MSRIERRRIERHAIDAGATLITPSVSIPVHAVDISPGGIRIVSPEPILPETDVALLFATEEEMLLSAAVLWSVELENAGGSPSFEVGLEAEAIILRDREAIGFTDRESLVREIIARIGHSAGED